MVFAAVALEKGTHIPVLTKPLLEMLGSLSGKTGIDCTVGLGGHARAILERESSVRLIGLDMDPSALERAKSNLASFLLR